MKRGWKIEDDPDSAPKRQRNDACCYREQAQCAGGDGAALSHPKPTGLTPMWVTKDKSGRLKLVSEHIPGTRDWRMGDPNMDICYVCKMKNNLFGCKTCMRSCHAICLTPPRKDSDVPSPFHCAHCIEKNWHTSPPVHILPLSVVTSPQLLSALGRMGERRGAIETCSSLYDTVPSTRHYSKTCERYTVSREMAASPTMVVSSSSSHRDQSKSRSAAFQDRSTGVLSQHGPCQQSPEFREHSTDRDRLECPAVSGPGRRSRYQTISKQVDDALSTIYRELEMGADFQSRIRGLQARVSFLEQELNITKGKAALSRQEVATEYISELKCLQAGLCMEKEANGRLVEENNRLKRRVEELSVADQLGELEEWKRRLREFVNTDT
ncbi:hypothetical protein FQN50_000257 [Emmonsiellopsis sp. PD_5]|nr:hypothetical protein FQN50_000257 [Emmonsiellopsis sp. PD_5]